MVRLRSPVKRVEARLLLDGPKPVSVMQSVGLPIRAKRPHGSRLMQDDATGIVTAPISAMTTTGAIHRPPTEVGCHVADGAWIDPSGACQDKFSGMFASLFGR